MKNFTLTMKIGCTVVLAPEFRRVGSYLVGLKEYQPYRCKKIVGDKIWIVTNDGIRPYPLHCFDPIGCKFGLFEKVRIYNSKRKIHSCVMRVISYSQGAYLISNGNMYDSKFLVPASDTDSHSYNISENTVNQQLPL